MRIQNLFRCVVCALLNLLFMAGCAPQETHPVAELPTFSITNEVVGGELRQVLVITNGMSLYFAPSDLVVWFQDESAVVFEFDPDTLELLNILLKRPPSGDRQAESLLDSNADGIPEFRQVSGGTTKEILYRGEWYPAARKGKDAVILVGTNDLEVTFDGRRWIESHDSLGADSTEQEE